MRGGGSAAGIKRGQPLHPKPQVRRADGAAPAGGRTDHALYQPQGVAGFVSCRACGHVIKCPHCDVSLSQHANGRMVCHYCGYTEPVPVQCPACGSKYISGFKAGTEKIEMVVRKRFPEARAAHGYGYHAGQGRLRADFIGICQSRGGYPDRYADDRKGA